MEQPTSAALLRQMHAAGGLPADALVADAKGRAHWVHGELLHRLALRRSTDGTARWVLHVGHPQLGLPFTEGGILALVPIRPADDEAVPAWPRTEAEVTPFLQAWYPHLQAAMAFVPDLRELCALLVAPGDVRRGHLVADLGAGYVERVLRALCIARAADDHEAAAVALAILQAAPADGSPASSLLDQARIWADQWSYQSGLHIEVPDEIERPAEPAVRAPALAELPPFWERVG